MTTLIITTSVAACIVLLGLLWRPKPRKVTFYMHYRRPYGECVRSVTIRGSQPTAYFPKVIVQQPDNITSEKIWFTDRNGRHLDSVEDFSRESGRMWWVTVVS